MPLKMRVAQAVTSVFCRRPLVCVDEKFYGHKVGSVITVSTAYRKLVSPATSFYKVVLVLG